MMEMPDLARLAAAAAAFALAIGAAACDMEILGTSRGEVVPERYSLTVTVTNVGTGFGRADVVFPSGTVENPCSDVLGPGDSCSPTATGPDRILTADIEVSAEPGSQFVGWTGTHCTGTSTECTVTATSGERDQTVDLDPRFDLLPSAGDVPAR